MIDTCKQITTITWGLKPRRKARNPLTESGKSYLWATGLAMISKMISCFASWSKILWNLQCENDNYLKAEPSNAIGLTNAVFINTFVNDPTLTSPGLANLTQCLPCHPPTLCHCILVQKWWVNNMALTKICTIIPLWKKCTSFESHNKLCVFSSQEGQCSRLSRTTGPLIMRCSALV